MKKVLLIAIGLGALAGVGGSLFLRGTPPPEPAGPAPVYDQGEVAANGTVEGARPEVALRPEVAGQIAVLHVRENQDVVAGTLLVELTNQSQQGQVALAEADLALARAQLERLTNGERIEKRRALTAAANGRRAIYLQAKAEYERAEGLRTSRAYSQEQLEGAYFKMARAEADWQEARAEAALVEAPARADDVRAAQAKVAAAQARLRLAQAELAKTRLLAPGAGRVLQVYAEPGELAGPATPQPVLVMADLSRRRVRAFVEELDVAKVKVGQPAVVTADGWPGQEFKGTVAVVVPRLGKRSPQSDAPGEYKDLYFREVLIDLGATAELPTNLRVQVRIRVQAKNAGP